MAEKVKRVVVATTDPNPQVSGRGIARLEEAGIEVTLGVKEEEATWQNRRFFHALKTGLPYVILKWAETADGYIARENYDSKWISDRFSRQVVHKWRSQEDAIMVGTNTAMHDNPQLTTRDWPGRHPVRVVIDRHLRLPPHLHLLDGSVRTLVYTLKEQTSQKNVEYHTLPAFDFLPQLLEHLKGQGLHSVVVEGGTALLQSLIEEELWQEARIFKSPNAFGAGIPAPVLTHSHMQAIRPLKQDQLLWYTATHQTRLSGVANPVGLD